MKKIISLLILLSLVLSLASCSLGNIPPENDPSVNEPSENEPSENEPPENEPSENEPSVVPPDPSKLNGTSLNEFTIIYGANSNDYVLRAAKYIRSEIESRTGVSLYMTTDNVAAGEHEIVVGDTNRAISEKLKHQSKSSEFSILADNGSVALEADYFIIAAAAYFFIETYVPSDDFAASIPEQTTTHMPIVKEAKNFIVLIGDGMGLYQTRLFDVLENDRNYSDGEDIFYGYYLPYFGSARTNSLSGTTDSAAASTALATGYKTVNGYVGIGPTLEELQSITELAASLGKSTSIMSTASETNATPAGFSAHAPHRDEEDDIAVDQAAMKESLGTIFYCGDHPTNKSGIKQIENKINTILNKLDDDEDGFFLMYEEAHIDITSHDNHFGDTFDCLIRFNQIIATFMEYAYYNPETAVIITADHETGDLKPNSNGVFQFNSGEHTSADVPVFVHGYGMDIFDDITIENVQIPKTLAAFMGVDDFGDQTSYPSLKE